MLEDQTFKALIVSETADQTFRRDIRDKTLDALPDNDVLIRVAYSSLNYKDALSATGNRGVTRKYPHTPGIDAAGTVEASRDAALAPGTPVIVTSYDLGMNTAGGFGQYIRVPGDWIVRLPAQLTLRESMVYGTAGFTAGMAVHELTATAPPEAGPVLVTGATGGVGSLAVALLAKLGYHVVAVSGKPAAKSFLTALGAAEVLDREALPSDRPMLKSRWAGVVDTVGGDILAGAIKAANPRSTVTCCGNVASPELPINVFPFILRGVRLVGIDSQNCPMAHRRDIWDRLARDWKPDTLARLSTEITLDELNPRIDAILQGQHTGRTIIRLA